MSNFFGTTARIGTDRNGAPFTRIRVLYEVTDSTWRAVDPSEFPVDGHVFWPQAKDALEGGLVFFRVIPNQSERDKNRATDVRVALEVVAVRANSDIDSLRQVLRIGAVSPTKFPGGRAYLACGEHDIVGPVKLKKGLDDRLTLEAAPLDRVPRYLDSDFKLRRIPFAYGTRAILDGAQQPTPVGWVDWDDDKLVVRRALSWAVGLVNAGEAKVAPVKRQIDEATDAIVRAAEGCEGGLEQYRMDRARKILNSAASTAGVASEIVEELKKLDWVQKELASSKETMREEERAKIRAELTVEQAALNEVKKGRERLEAEAKGIESKVASLRTRNDAQAKELEAEFERRIAKVLQKPTEFLAEVGMLRVVAGVGPGTNGPTRTRAGGRSVAYPWSVAPTVLPGPKELRKALVATMRAMGVAPSTAARIHAAFTAGLVPILAGVGARSALEAYSRVACGGRVARISVSPALLESTDLFGRVDSSSGEFIQHSGELLSLCVAGKGKSESAMALLEGMNRGPTESYLLPLVQAQDAGLPVRVGNAGDSAGEGVPNGPDLEIPRNVRFAGTVVEGPTSLPLSRDIWAYATLIEVESCAPSGSMEGLSEASFKSTSDSTIDASALVEELLEAVPDCQFLEHTLSRYAAALAGVEADRERVKQALVESVLLPQALLADEADVREKALDTLCALLPSEPDRVRLRVAGPRLRRRIA